MTSTRATPRFPARSIDKGADILRLHELMPKLSDEEITAVYFRFWENLLIEDIAKILGRSWDYTDRLIEQSIRELRTKFIASQEIGSLAA